MSICCPLPTPSFSLSPSPCAVLLWQHHFRRCQYPDLVNIPLPPPLETFTWTHCLFWFLRWRLHCCRRDLGIIFLWQRLCCCSQFPRTVITTPQPPPLSLISQTHRLLLVLCWCLRHCRLRSPVSERLPTFALLSLYFFWWGFSLLTVGRANLPYLVWNDTVENSWGLNWIPIEFMRNIQSFGLILIYVVYGINKRGKRVLRLSSQWNTTYLWVVDFVFCLVIVCTCDYWAR